MKFGQVNQYNFLQRLQCACTGTCMDLGEFYLMSTRYTFHKPDRYSSMEYVSRYHGTCACV